MNGHGSSLPRRGQVSVCGSVGARRAHAVGAGISMQPRAPRAADALRQPPPCPLPLQRRRHDSSVRAALRPPAARSGGATVPSRRRSPTPAPAPPRTSASPARTRRRTPSGDRYASGPIPASSGSAATAIRPAARAAALLMPLASPARAASTEARTVAVSGATSVTMPAPRTSSAGRTSARYEAPGPDPQHQQHPGGAQQRADGERDARADAVGQLARAGGEQQHQHGRRQQRRTRARGPSSRRPPGAGGRRGRRTRRRPRTRTGSPG